MRRGGSIYDTELHSSPIYTGSRTLMLSLICIYRNTYACVRTSTLENKKKKELLKKRACARKMMVIRKEGRLLQLIQAGGGYYRLNAAQWARRRPSVAGRPRFLGVRAEGFLWLRCCLRPGGADLQAAWGHATGILPEQPGGGQSSHTAAACTSGV